jgi:hypothetical protein
MFRSVALATALLILAWNPPVHAQVKLEQKYTEGSKTKKQTRVKAHQVMAIAGMNTETDSEFGSTSTIEVGKRKSDGSLPITDKTDSIRVNLMVNGQSFITYDSANPPQKKEEGPLAFLQDLFKVLIGMAYTVVLDKDNKFVSIEGLQDVLQKADNLDPMAVDALKKQLDNDRVKREFEQARGSLPGILVRPGETWDRTEVLELGQGQTFTFDKRYEYKGTVEKDGKMLDKIAVTASTVKYEMDPNNPMIKVNKSDLKVDSADGTILFDRAAGHAVESQMKYKIKGTMTLTINGNDLPADLDIELDTNSTTTPL